MRRRGLLLLLAPAVCGIISVGSASAATTKVIDYHGDIGSLGNVHDYTAANNYGVIHTANGGSVTEPGGAGFLRFPQTSCTASSGCPVGRVEPVDTAAFGVGSGNFTFGATIRISDQVAGAGLNVFQRGLADDPGGQWKLQADRRKPQCAFKDSSGAAISVPNSSNPINTTLALNTWYSISCTRSGNTFSLKVLNADGTTWATRSATASLGAISPSAPNTSDVSIGSKEVPAGTALADTNTDQFHGDMKSIFFNKL